MVKRQPSQTLRRSTRRDVAKTHRSEAQPLVAKPKGPTACPKCRAVFHNGRWSWARVPAGARSKLCPACLRIKDGTPHGWLEVRGDYAKSHQADILRLIKHEEAAERRTHPLARIANTMRRPDGLDITTTDPHLPRRIGERLRHAYRGALDVRYGEEGIVHVTWTRMV